MNEQKYLRQKATGTIFVYTERLAMRDDMVECSVEYVRTRHAAMEKKLKEAKEELANAQPVSAEIAGLSKELAEMETEYSDIQEQIRIKKHEPELPMEEKEPETDEEAKQVEIDKDPEIVKIKSMDDIVAIALYIEAEYGEKTDLEENPDLEELRTRAIDLRTARIMEA